MYRIGVIGDRDSVLGCQAFGLEVCPANSAEDARQALHRMANAGFAILYLTEQLAAQLGPELALSLIHILLCCSTGEIINGCTLFDCRFGCPLVASKQISAFPRVQKPKP